MIENSDIENSDIENNAIENNGKRTAAPCCSAARAKRDRLPASKALARSCALPARASMYGRYDTSMITDDALAYIERHKGAPFFLYAAYNARHSPI